MRALSFKRLTLTKLEAAAGFRFAYSNESDNASSYTIATNSGVITNAVLQNADIRISHLGSSAVLFDNPTLWGGSGHVELPAQASWGLPGAAWTGEVCIVASCITITPQWPLNVNSELLYDGPWEHTGTPATLGNLNYATDGWMQVSNGSTGGKATWQNIINSSCGGSEYQERAVVTTAYTVGTTDNYAMRSILDGGAIQQLGWGTASAQPITVDLWLKANYTGVVTFFASNSSGTRMFTQDLTLPSTTGTCQEYTFQIPGYTAGSGFTLTTDNVGMRFGLDLAAGGNFQTTPGSWQTLGTGIPASGSANTTNFLGTLSNQINVGPVRLYGGYYLPIYLPKAPQAAVGEIERLWQKSPPIGTAPSANNTYQNVGATGAFTFSARVAGTGSNTQSVWVPFHQRMAGRSGSEPAVTGYSTAANTANCYDATGSADSGALSITNVSNAGFEATCTLGASVAAGDVIQFNWTAAAAQ